MLAELEYARRQHRLGVAPEGKLRWSEIIASLESETTAAEKRLYPEGLHPEEPPEAPLREWECPITMQIMYEPAILPSGHSHSEGPLRKHCYELSDIVRWIAENGTDPQTREEFDFTLPIHCDNELGNSISRWRNHAVAHHVGRSRGLMATQDLLGAAGALEDASEVDPRNVNLLEELIELYVGLGEGSASGCVCRRLELERDQSRLRASIDQLYAQYSMPAEGRTGRGDEEVGEEPDPLRTALRREDDDGGDAREAGWVRTVRIPLRAMQEAIVCIDRAVAGSGLESVDSSTIKAGVAATGVAAGVYGTYSALAVAPAVAAAPSAAGGWWAGVMGGASLASNSMGAGTAVVGTTATTAATVNAAAMANVNTALAGVTQAAWSAKAGLLSAQAAVYTAAAQVAAGHTAVAATTTTAAAATTTTATATTTGTAAAAVGGATLLGTVGPMVMAGAAGAALMGATVAMSKGQRRGRMRRRREFLQHSRRQEATLTSMGSL